MFLPTMFISCFGDLSEEHLAAGFRDARQQELTRPGASVSVHGTLQGTAESFFSCDFLVRTCDPWQSFSMASALAVLLGNLTCCHSLTCFCTLLESPGTGTECSPGCNPLGLAVGTACVVHPLDTFSPLKHWSSNDVDYVAH